MEKWADNVMDGQIISRYKSGSRRQGTRFFKNQPLFLLDSSDFHVLGFKGMTKKNILWSYKLNGAGRRYMLLTDGNGIPMKIFGGYSPKLYDGRWVEAKIIFF